MRIHKLHPRLRPASSCLFLDVDGTLIELATTPDEVVVDASVERLLDDASVACGGAVALISGRSIAQLDALFAPHRWPAAGLHGLERRDARGGIHVHPTEPLPAALLEEMQALARRHRGLLLEDKGRAIALHYRHAADLQTMLEREVHELAHKHGAGEMHVQPGAYVLELKASGITKAHAIEAFVDEPPFAGRTPVFAGDDLTDLHGFEAVDRLGGLSIAVGPRVSARFEVDSPNELRALLAEFIARDEAA